MQVQVIITHHSTVHAPHNLKRLTLIPDLACLFFKQKTAYEIMSGDWSSDVCSSD
eukprot:COSAG06_NODE_22179_length_731_cov_1.422468_2_plen_54_part_01